MSFAAFLLAELRHRRKGVLSALLVVLIASAVVTFLSLTSSASIRSIQLITKNMGQNLFLVHDSTRLEDYYNASGREVLFSETAIDTLLGIERIVTTYHVALLQLREIVRGKSLILTGAHPVKGAREASPGDKKNPYLQIPSGTVRLGSEAALETGLKTGDTVHILGTAFVVTRLEDETGTTDDYRVYCNLSELQSLTGKAGRINVILSMECLCDGEPLSVTEKRIKNTLETALPHLKVVTLRHIALARYEAREVMNRYNRAILTLVLLAAMAFIAIQAHHEARQREKETALLLALGFRQGLTAGLYAVKALIIALPAPALGYLAGYAAAVRVGPAFAKAKVFGDPSLLPWLILGSLTVVLIAFIPALSRTLKTDPFEILRED